jgi:hypothetical protein
VEPPPAPEPELDPGDVTGSKVLAPESPSEVDPDVVFRVLLVPLTVVATPPVTPLLPELLPTCPRLLSPAEYPLPCGGISAAGVGGKVGTVLTVSVDFAPTYAPPSFSI